VSNPISSDLRRDLGVHAGLTAIAHTLVGLTVHFRGQMPLYFVTPTNQEGAVAIRLDAFGLSNHAGLLGALILLGLVAISTDAALTRLGARCWKRAQRFAYLGAILVVLHGTGYILLEERSGGMAGVFVLLVAFDIVFQAWGAALTGPRGRSPR
jgi:sulfoxide reductase heme-binding subunit YedZ